MEKNEIKNLVLTALFTALIIAGSFIAVPVGPVPVVLATLFVLLAGMLLGPKAGGTAVAVYLLLGAVGLPVFSGGKGGLATLTGPTGGYLIGYLLAAVLCGFMVNPQKREGKVSLTRLILAALGGTFVIYLVGVPFLKIRLALEWPGAMAAGLTPFIPGDILKGITALILARVFIPRIQGEGK